MFYFASRIPSGSICQVQVHRLLLGAVPGAWSGIDHCSEFSDTHDPAERIRISNGASRPPRGLGPEFDQESNSPW